jgi:hypothetical protein
MPVNPHHRSHRSPFVQLHLFSRTSVPLGDGRRDRACREWTLSDIKAFALDPELHVRCFAAQSPWAVDADVQLVLAVDPEEAVVMQLLQSLDPCLEAVEVILAGPHREARRMLAGRNLRTELLLGLVDDTDHEVRNRAMATLARRGVLDVEVAV